MTVGTLPVLAAGLGEALQSSLSLSPKPPLASLLPCPLMSRVCGLLKSGLSLQHFLALHPSVLALLQPVPLHLQRWPWVTPWPLPSFSPSLQLCAMCRECLRAPEAAFPSLALSGSPLECPTCCKEGLIRCSLSATVGRGMAALGRRRAQGPSCD